MSEMVERVSRALCRVECIANNCPADQVDWNVNVHWWAHEDEARAAIAAMLTPTTQMLFEGVVAQDSDDPVVQNIYQAMIGAALQEA